MHSLLITIHPPTRYPQEDSWPSVYNSEPWKSEEACEAAVMNGHYISLNLLR
jgi:hypothetical protein